MEFNSIFNCVLRNAIRYLILSFLWNFNMIIDYFLRNSITKILDCILWSSIRSLIVFLWKSIRSLIVFLWKSIRSLTVAFVLWNSIDCIMFNEFNQILDCVICFI